MCIKSGPHFMKRSQTATLIVSLVCMTLVLAACSRTPQQREARFLKAGLELAAKKDFQRAILNFLNAARANPADAEPQYQLGLAYLATQNPSAAATAFRKATDLNPQHWNANLKLAELMSMTRNEALLQEAADRIHAVLGVLPDNAEASDALAVTEFQTGKASEAASRLEETLVKFPAHLQSARLFARLKLSQKDYRGAEDVLEKAAAAAPTAPEAALALAQVFLVADLPEKAETQARKVLGMSPGNAEALWTLAASQSRRADWEGADQTYRELAALPDRRFRSAHALFIYHRGKRADAVAELEQLFERDKDNRELRTQLLAALLELNQNDRARAIIAGALKRNPNDTDALLQRSELWLRSGNAVEAANDLTNVLHSQPDSPQAHYLLAIVEEAGGREESARQQLDEALKLDRHLLAARIEMAKNLMRANQAKAAVQVLDAAPPSQKNAQAVVIEQNWALLQAGEIRAVRQILDQLLPANKMPELLLQDSAAKLAEHDYEGARRRAEQVLEVSPEDVRAARVIAQAYTAQHQSAKAQERLEQISATRPKSEALRELMGGWYLNAGKMDEAGAAFEAALADDPNSTSAELGLADVERHQKHLDTAIQRVSRVLSVEPRNIKAALMIADFQREAGNMQASIEGYRAALKIDGSNVVGLNNLAYLIAPENPAEALELAQKAAAIAPGNPTIQDTLGRVYYCQGSYVEAVDYLKTVFEKEPTAQHQFHLAMSYLRSGDRVTGGKLLESALRQDPNLARTEVGW
jgi:tetratricopeptide (TPR) repeat protein